MHMYNIFAAKFYSILHDMWHMCAIVYLLHVYGTQKLTNKLATCSRLTVEARGSIHM